MSTVFLLTVNVRGQCGAAKERRAWEYDEGATNVSSLLAGEREAWRA